LVERKSEKQKHFRKQLKTAKCDENFLTDVAALTKAKDVATRIMKRIVWEWKYSSTHSLHHH
jgi:hypothetical protein